MSIMGVRETTKEEKLRYLISAEETGGQIAD